MQPRPVTLEAIANGKRVVGIPSLTTMLATGEVLQAVLEMAAGLRPCTPDSIKDACEGAMARLTTEDRVNLNITAENEEHPELLAGALSAAMLYPFAVSQR